MSDEDNPPVINMEFAMEQCMEDKEFLSELLNEMLSEEQLKLSELSEAIDKDDHSVSHLSRL